MPEGNISYKPQRINSVDLLRGIVIIVMALDHVRHFFGKVPYNPLSIPDTSVELFLTRWITHFCAPVFVFLAGTSAWLHQTNTDCSKRELSRFLLTRGLWLIFLELTVVSLSWKFTWRLHILQVIWAIGWSMIALSLLVHLRLWIIAGIGLVMIAGHNLLDSFNGTEFGDFTLLWSVFHERYATQIIPGTKLIVLYPLVPWIGVMALGYSFAHLFRFSEQKRNRLSVYFGLSAILLFIILRLINIYGDPQPWQVSNRGVIYTLLSFVNTSKYPPSLLFLLMTLGPALLIVPLLENTRGILTDVLKVFGRVPLFFYLIHLPVIHLLAIGWSYAVYGRLAGWLSFEPSAWPEEYELNLWLIYGVWILVLALHYPLCRWFAKVKREQKSRLLSYL
ncbi:MAG: DUF1624 domain-containing protein [Proteobacteria bacterium]|nr:DUF1624 domain-containing protein [Pseudomonadota bacterium]